MELPELQQLYAKFLMSGGNKWVICGNCREEAHIWGRCCSCDQHPDDIEVQDGAIYIRHGEFNENTGEDGFVRIYRADKDLQDGRNDSDAQ